jgi:hypothetical protein
MPSDGENLGLLIRNGNIRLYTDIECPTDTRVQTYLFLKFLVDNLKEVLITVRCLCDEFHNMVFTLVDPTLQKRDNCIGTFLTAWYMACFQNTECGVNVQAFQVLGTRNIRTD